LIGFWRVTPGSEFWGGHCSIPRHRHDQPYAALVLSGSYQESGSLGRYHAQAGHVLLHRTFDAHLDRFGSRGARIVNLPLRTEPTLGLGGVPDPDVIARLAERDPTGAAAALAELLLPRHSAAADWPDLLAQDLRDDPQLRLDDWASRHGLAAATLSRGFGKVFGISPAGYRLEVRAQRALRLIFDGQTSLAAAAAIAGFADQAHMTRAVTAVTGRAPGYWARSNRFKKPHAPADHNGAWPTIQPPVP
jgi:AraC-like DNA-binding protein